MMHRSDPARVGKRMTLRVGNRYQRELAILTIERNQFRQVETSVQRGEVRRREAASDREMQLRNVKVNHVEFAGALRHLLDHQHVLGKKVAPAAIEPLRPFADWCKRRTCLGVTAREQ